MAVCVCVCVQAAIQWHAVNDFNYYLRALKCILHMNTQTAACVRAKRTRAQVFGVVHAEHHPIALHQCAVQRATSCTHTTVYRRISKPTNNWSKQLEKKAIIRFNAAPKNNKADMKRNEKKRIGEERKIQNKVRVKRTNAQHMHNTLENKLD